MKGEDLICELFKSLNGKRKAARNCENKWQKVPIDKNFEVGTWSSTFVRCGEPELCWFVHGVHVHGRFSATGVGGFSRGERFLVRTMGPDDGDDKKVTILS